MNLRENVCRHLLSLLDQQGNDYCLMNGTGEFPQSNSEDLDILIGQGVTLDALATLVQKNSAKLQATLVKRNVGFLVLLCDGQYAPPQFLLLDFVTENSTASVSLFPGVEILARRRRIAEAFVAAPDAAFCMSFAKGVQRGRMGDERKARLRQLLQTDRSACLQAASKLWPDGSIEEIVSKGGAASLPAASNFSGKASVFARGRQMLRNIIHPPGFHIVMLGPDGAGKSSVVDTLEATMTGPFADVVVLGFAPPLYKLWRRGPSNTSTPHAARPRSYGVSMLRGFFWLGYNLVGHITLRLAKTRNTLIVNDRHFIDILVDPVRYRYGGPRWLLQLICFVMPKPDATVLLYGPPEVLQARKNELSVEETARQCADYLALVNSQSGGKIVDAAQPFDGVMRDVLSIIYRRA
jgi:thymidylate kinase